MPKTKLDSDELAFSPAMQPSPRSPGSAAGKPLLLLMCDNMMVARREVLPILHRGGYEIEMVEALLRSLPDLHGRPYDIVVMDVATRDSAAFSICQQIRSSISTPIMLVLRGGARENVLRCFECGADTYVLAPFDSREFLARLRSLTRGYRHITPPV